MDGWDLAVLPAPDELRRAARLSGPLRRLGAELARLEFAVGLPAILGAFPQLRLAADVPLPRGARTLLVTW